MSAAQTAERVTVPMESSTRAALESTVSDKMSAIFQDGDDEVVDSPAAVEKTEPKPQEAAQEKEPEAAKEESKVEPEPKDEAADEQAEETKPTPVATLSTTIPAAYRRSLKAYQWTDEEIDSGLKSNPEAFLKTAEKMHMSRVQQTQQWADLGKQAKATASAAPATATPAKIDIAALEKQYGANEPFIVALKHQASLLEQTQAFMEQSTKRQQAAEMDTLAKQIDSYFAGDELKPYHDHYGKAGGTLTQEQTTNRMKVLETADLLISGARSVGRPITLDEAMTMAHDSVSSPIAAKVAVKKVQTSVKQRQAAITVRPGSRGGDAAPAKTRTDLESKVGKGLKAIFK